MLPSIGYTLLYWGIFAPHFFVNVLREQTHYGKTAQTAFRQT